MASKAKIVIFVCMLLAVSTYIYIQYWHNVDFQVHKLPPQYKQETWLPSAPNNTKVLSQTKTKVILLFTPFYMKFGISKQWTLQNLIGPGMFDKLECAVRDCIVVEDRKFLSKSDAILFSPDYHRWLKNENPPVVSNRMKQRWVWVETEAPIYFKSWYYKSLPRWKSNFNWTMTFRRDSDIPIPYGKLKLRDEKIHKNYTEMAMKKTLKIAWMVSSCSTQSKRMKYVKLLQKYVQVDIYGNCGTHKCKGSYYDKSNHDKCMRTIAEKYKYYLSFENTLCKDYITEKFFKIIDFYMIPIVRSGGDYSRFTKDKFYVDAKDFKSPKQLAEHLQYLEKNPKEYAKLMELKDKYKNVRDGRVAIHQEWCDLCKKLHYDLEPKIYKDVAAWFESPGACVPPTDLS